MFEQILVRLPGILISEFIWSIASVVVSSLISVFVMRLFLSLKLSDILHEIEEDQNAGVGAAFFAVFLSSGFLVGRTLQSPAQETSWSETAIWVTVAIFVILVVFLLCNWILLHMVASRKGESIRQYIHREVVVEDNAALMLMVGGLLANISLIVGHITL